MTSWTSRFIGAAVIASLVAVALSILSPTASDAKVNPLCEQGSQGGRGHTTISNGCGVTGGGSSDNDNSNSSENDNNGRHLGESGGSSTHVESPQDKYDKKLSEIEKRNSAEMDRYRAEIGRINNMMENGNCVSEGTNTNAGNACPSVTPPNLTPLPNPPKGVKPPAQPPMTPIEAAYLAIATKLRINAPGVGIGPDPDLSRWKMAVVGHSYWLWATGPTHLGPVSDSASGRTVTLEANLSSVTFQMGDGGVVKCKGAGTPYPGDKTGLYSRSPTCGYTYQTASKHHTGGTYPVRAISYWSVAYTAPDGAGTIPIVLATERDLKVGELQTVITH